jgi:zinc transport system ATP-binding protein
MQAVDHNENIIELEHISFSYGGNEVLKDINFIVHRGDYLGLVGGNGAGKTTLIKIMLGLLVPTTGTVKLFGKEIKQFKDWSKIGYVPQKVTNFDAKFPITVEEVVLMGRYGKKGLFHSVTKKDYDKAKEALEYVDMWAYRKRLIGDLSGGQQQRVFIARALAGEPEVVLLDEPTVGVEKAVKDEFYALLRKLNEEMRLTVILVTHDIESMAHQAMHVVCIDCNTIFHDSVDAFLQNKGPAEHPHSRL